MFVIYIGHAFLGDELGLTFSDTLSKSEWWLMEMDAVSRDE